MWPEEAVGQSLLSWRERAWSGSKGSLLYPLWRVDWAGCRCGAARASSRYLLLGYSRHGSFAKSCAASSRAAQGTYQLSYLIRCLPSSPSLRAKPKLTRTLFLTCAPSQKSLLFEAPASAEGDPIRASYLNPSALVFGIPPRSHSGPPQPTWGSSTEEFLSRCWRRTHSSCQTDSRRTCKPRTFSPVPTPARLGR
jgi:hypothetical protein